MIENLLIDKNMVNNCFLFALWETFLRSFYFSIVTMTTLGFGDMHASHDNLWGYVALIFHVILGYVLLANLVTRFAVLFTANGPPADHLMKMKVSSLRYFWNMMWDDVKAILHLGKRKR
jgi:Ni,Fe-hydrogenase I cytochrome b subunit